MPKPQPSATVRTTKMPAARATQVLHIKNKSNTAPSQPPTYITEQDVLGSRAGTSTKVVTK